ncbi:hypothetical protein AKO1_011516 [Acrasis kona]|uniref:NADH dehydrogenase [ubiquinone] 1 beta subcomplex subunit 10 n=1 Tax=Acrasis kona TaxID=1008807 RepID=A0AAW2Z2S5_9EUKA
MNLFDYIATPKRDEKYTDEFEEPYVPGTILYDEQLRREVNDPVRIRKNPQPKIVHRGTEDAAGHYDHKEWMVKEWGVYMGMIAALREEALYCFRRYGALSEYKCNEQIRAYLRHANQKNLYEKRHQLAKGERLVE